MTTALLSPEGGDPLEHIARARALLAFDYDGTLAPGMSDRGAAPLRPVTYRLLRTAAVLYPCAVISGRARADVAAHLEGISLVAVVGNDGAEIIPGPLDKVLRKRVAEWEAILAPLLADIEDVDLENKGLSLAFHHRHARSWSAARRRIRQLVSRLERAIAFEGHAVVNVQPEDAPTMANAIREICARLSLDTVVHVGDERSDEEALRCEAVSVAMRISVDPFPPAKYTMSGQSDLDQLLRELVLARVRIHGRAPGEGLLRAPYQ